MVGAARIAQFLLHRHCKVAARGVRTAGQPCKYSDDTSCNLLDPARKTSRSAGTLNWPGVLLAADN